MVRRIRGEVRRDDIFGDIAISGCEVPSVFPHDAFDSSCLSKLLQLRAGHARISETAGIVREGELHHSIGARVRERTDQDAVDDAEHRARGAYPKGQREDRGEREPRAAAQFPHRIAKIGDDRAHDIALDELRAGRVGRNRRRRLLFSGFCRKFIRRACPASATGRSW
jgi:hypothetical protein